MRIYKAPDTTDIDAEFAALGAKYTAIRLKLVNLQSKRNDMLNAAFEALPVLTVMGGYGRPINARLIRWTASSVWVASHVGNAERGDRYNRSNGQAVGCGNYNRRWINDMSALESAIARIEAS